MKKIIYLIAAILLLRGNNLSSQTLGEKLSLINGIYSDKYLEPLNLAMGMNLNSGYVGTTNMQRVANLPVNMVLFFGVNTSAVFLQDKDRTFSVNYFDSVMVNIEGTNQKVGANISLQNAPTIFGSTSPAVANVTYNNNGTQETIQRTFVGGMANTSTIPFIVPQIGVGSIYGADITVRFVPRMTIGQYGEIMFTGVGIRYNLNYLLKKLPMGLGVQSGFQNFNIVDDNGVKFFNANSFFANVQVSKSIRRLSLYGALQYETFNTDVTYSYTNMTGENYGVYYTKNSSANVRGVIGVGLNLIPVIINADLNFGKRLMVTLGVGVGLR